MDAENFFSRWSRRKAQARQEEQESTAEAKQPVDAMTEQAVQDPPPTMEDVAALTPESDFRRFMAQGVDPDVRRSAMKKMFSDPHFNAMDGLDIYIDDYNKFQPLPDAMLAALNHAQGVLNPQPLFDTTPEKLLDETAPAPTTEEESTEAGKLSAMEEGDETPTDTPGEPTAESTADEGTAATAPHQHTENPEGRPDHGNQISGM